MKKSPFWMEISPFKCCSEAFGTFFENNLNREFSPFKKLKWRNLHSEWRFLYSNVFQKRFEFFFEKQTPQIVFSIQNGEISILNGDFSIYFFQTCTVFWTFLKKNSTESFLRSEWRSLHSEWRFLHSHVSQKCSVFLKHLYRDFSPFKCFFWEVIWAFFKTYIYI